jgi:hypothetical protein
MSAAARFVLGAALLAAALALEDSQGPEVYPQYGMGVYAGDVRACIEHRAAQAASWTCCPAWTT